MAVPFFLTFLTNVRKKGAAIITPINHIRTPILMLMLIGGRRMVVTALAKTQSSEQPAPLHAIHTFPFGRSQEGKPGVHLPAAAAPNRKLTTA